MLLPLDDRTVLVSRPAFNDAIALRDTDGDGAADRMTTVAYAAERAHGLARRADTIWIAGLHEILTASWRTASPACAAAIAARTCSWRFPVRDEGSVDT